MRSLNLLSPRGGLAVLLATSGLLYITHLTGWQQISCCALPGNPSLWALAGGLALIGGALAIALRRFDRPVALMLSLVLMLFAAIVYAPCMGEKAHLASTSMNLFKDMALAGCSLAYAGLMAAKL